MPRKSAEAAALSIVTGLPGQRQQPPARLSSEGAEIWREIVATKPPDWFNADTCHLLEALCVATVTHRAVAKELMACSTLAGGAVEGQAGLFDRAEQAYLPLDGSTPTLVGDAPLQRYDRLTKIADRQVRVMASIATKLRLTNQSRYTPAAANTASQKAKGARPWD